MTGHYQIGDLQFEVEGDLKELAHCQEIIREIKKAERDLKQVAGSKYINLIYDQDLEGEQGTFDKMRLRAYNNGRSYDLDIGHTDKNPLGIYVGYDENIRVYDYDEEESWHLTREGDRVQSGGESRAPQEGGSSSAPDRSPQAGQQSDPEEPELQVTQEDRKITSAASRAVNQGKGDQSIGQEAAKIVWSTMQRNGLGESTYKSACEAFDLDTLGDLPYSDVRDLYEWVRDRVVYENEADLPF